MDCEPDILDILDGPDRSWMTRGACAGMPDHELFFPGQGESTKEAKAVCAECPVREECLEYALTTREKHGIWGGTSFKQRRPMLRARRGAAA